MNLFSPAQIAENYVSIGKSKVNTAIPKMFLLAVMAGVFIALGGVAATTAAVGVQPAAIGKLLGACIFPGGLTMVLLWLPEPYIRISSACLEMAWRYP